MGESHISVSHCFTSLSVLHWPYSFSARPRAGTQCSASPPGPTSHAPSHHGILAPWLNLWLLVGGGYGLGDHRERRVAKAVPRFPSGLLGANECTEPQPGVGVGTASMFSFCSVCFLFRSTAQFWFGLLRADGLWQVRISGATRLCLLQGCGLSSWQPLRELEVQPALLTCQPLSFHFSLFSFPLFFILCLSASLYFLSHPLNPALPFSLFSWSLSPSLLRLPVPLLFSSSFRPAISPFSISPFLFQKEKKKSRLGALGGLLWPRLPHLLSLDDLLQILPYLWASISPFIHRRL